MLDQQPPSTPPDLSADPRTEAGPAETARPFRNDRVSPLAILLLVVFWILQSSFLTAIISRIHSHSLSHAASAVNDGTVPGDLEQGLIGIDVGAKSAYLFAGAEPGSFQSQLQPAVDTSRKTALMMAESLLRRYPDQPSLARRVILLRAESGNTDPLMQPLNHSKHRPLDAYDPVPGLTPGIAAQLADERQTWQTLFGARRRFSPQQEQELAAHIRGMANLRWWRNIALHQLAVKSGDGAMARRSLISASREAGKTIAVYIVVIGLMLLLGLIGIASLIFVIVRSKSGPLTTESIFDPRPPLISDADRRLGAGDLINLFILYLILMMGLNLAAGPVLGALVGKDKIDRLPQSDLVMISVIANAVGIVLVGGLTVAALTWLARRRGADISREIGLNAGGKPFWQMALFGLLGWAIGLPIVWVVAFITQSIFHSAPSPANPIIPLIASTHSIVGIVAMYILVAVIAPMVEETMFRGLFFNAARLRLGANWAIALTGITFGLAHPVGIAEQITLASLGCVLAWMAQTKKSLLPGMVAHAIQNTFATTMLLVSVATVTVVR